MKVLQVKQYHQIVARPKQERALEAWRAKDNGYCYPVNSMFFFMLEDNQGYPTEKRRNGYVAFDYTRSVFGNNKEEAIRKFNQKAKRRVYG